MSEALEAILGENATGLSPTNITRLKESCEEEYQEWEDRDLSDREYVYFWADDIYFNVRLADDRPCMLVIIGTRKDGTKELVAVKEGVRESKLSWKELLLDLKSRGLQEGPQLAVGDGGHGFWVEIDEVYPQTEHQRCWGYKKNNILNKLPKSMHGEAKEGLNEIKQAPGRKQALEAFDRFENLFGDKYPNAWEFLKKDKEVLLNFFYYPTKDWTHIRTTNTIESTFATVRHRTRQTKGCGSRKATRAMVYKLTREAEDYWRRINGYDQIDKVIRGVEFNDGEVVNEDELKEEEKGKDAA
jgi:transposase-like protein